MNAKKLVSMILALVMLLALGTSAMAEDATYTITIKNANASYEYEAYQIFDGDLSDSKLSNITWGAGIDTTKESALLTDLKAITIVEGETTKNPFESCADAGAVAEALAKYSDNSEEAKAFANVVSKYLSATKGTSTYDSDSKIATISDLDAGYYLVKNSSVGTGASTSYTSLILEVVKNVDVTHKGTVPEAEKKIVDNSEEVDANEASIGETVNYKITGTLPSNIADYNTYYYVFNDTLSKGLTYTANSVKVTVGDVDVTKYFYAGATKNEDGTTSLTVGIQDLLALQNVENLGITISASTEVVVTYSAVLNENAEVENGNTNTVKLEYSNDPNNSGEGKSEGEPEENPEDEPTTNEPTGETPEDTVKTYTTELIIKKVDENGNMLTGAAFQIKGIGTNMVVTTGTVYVASENGTYYKLKNGTYTTTTPTEETKDAYVDGIGAKKYEEKTVATITADEENDVYVEAFVDADGKLKFTGLGAGSYTITETVTPPGYNSIEPITVAIGWDAEKGFTYTGTDFDDKNSNGVKDDDEDNINTVTVVNKSGATLPSTGGMGTTVLYIAGGLLVAAAVIMMITRRRAGAAE